MGIIPQSALLLLADFVASLYGNSIPTFCVARLTPIYVSSIILIGSATSCGFYHYPSGMRLNRSAGAVATGLRLLKERYGFQQCDVVAHSMWRTRGARRDHAGGRGRGREISLSASSASRYVSGRSASAREPCFLRLS